MSYSYRVGKNTFFKAKSTTKKIKLSPDTALLYIDGTYTVRCECGWERHIKLMELDLLKRGIPARFNCTKCGCRHYNIVDTHGYLNQKEPAVNAKKPRINKELKEIILRSGLTVQEIMLKYSVSYQSVTKIFRNKNKSNRNHL